MSTDSSLRITGLLLGGFLSLIFIGYTVLSISEGKKYGGASAPKKFAGTFSLALGLIMLGAWIYLITTGWAAFLTQAEALSIHVLTELISAVTLIVAGVAMLRNWSRGPALLMIANGVLLFTTMLTLASYGATGHPFLMNGIAILLVIVSVYLVGLVYGWEHFVLHLDEQRPHEKKRAS